MGELREIWLIRSNFPGFSVDGQGSETSQLNMGEFYCEMRGIRVICGICVRTERICLIRWNFREFSATGQASET